MKYPEEPVPNELLRRARILKSWSQAELAKKVGTSFEMVAVGSAASLHPARAIAGNYVPSWAKVPKNSD